jgi:Domain of unknown function (DUF4383)
MARDVARGIAALVGLILVALGLLGLVDNPLVGTQGVFATDLLHDLVHVFIGLFVFRTSFDDHEDSVHEGLAVVGIVLAGLFVLPLVDGDAFGFLSVPASPADIVLHGSLSAICLVTAVRARIETRSSARFRDEARLVRVELDEREDRVRQLAGR